MVETKLEDSKQAFLSLNGTPHEGRFIWERGTNYGFIVKPGSTSGDFLSARTLKESHHGDLRKMDIRELNGKRVSYHLRPSGHARHEGKLEAYQVSLVRDVYPF